MTRIKLLKQNARKNGKPPEPSFKEVMAMLGMGIPVEKPILVPIPQKR